MTLRLRDINAFILFLFLLLLRTATSAQINVSPSQTAAILAQKLAGQGVTITNATLQCAAQANGLFDVTSSNLGLGSGIVLTTGRAATLGSSYGVNGYSSFLASNDNGVAGDPELDVLAGQTTTDACALEFDLLPNGDTIKFNYVFSSEEYLNAVCGPYNDAFAFFISGPGIAGSENMALVPGTNIPVTINSINNGIPGKTGTISNCTKMGPGSPFTSYYIDNSSGQTLTHQGFTSVLQAVHAVTPCNLYHLKIVIADAGDPLYDSGVFLEANSLQTDNYSIKAQTPNPAPAPNVCIKGCLPGHFQVKRTAANSQPQIIRFYTGGTAISGTDYSPIADSVTIPSNDSVADIVINGLPTPLLGAKVLTIFILPPYPCNGISNILDSASITIYDTIHISILTPDMDVCRNDTIQLQVDGDSILTYNWTPAIGLSNPGIKDPVVFPAVNTTYWVTASVPGSSCASKTASVNLSIKATPDIILIADTTVCFNTKFQLNASTAGESRYYSYKWVGPGSFTSSLINPVVDTATPKTGGTYTITVTDNTNGCKSDAGIHVIVNTPDTPTVTSPAFFCVNNPAIPLTATGQQLLWYDANGMNATTVAPSPPTYEINTYTYFVSQTINNCESPKAEIEADVTQCCDGIINIPTAFTPNGDGRNDKFEPLEDYGYTIKSMLIVNRWGQVVYSGTTGVWDGTYKGMPAEMGTYFYYMSFGCILGGTAERKGDVILIR